MGPPSFRYKQVWMSLFFFAWHEFHETNNQKFSIQLFRIECRKCLSRSCPQFPFWLRRKPLIFSHHQKVARARNFVMSIILIGTFENYNKKDCPWLWNEEDNCLQNEQRIDLLTFVLKHIGQTHRVKYGINFRMRLHASKHCCTLANCMNANQVKWMPTKLCGCCCLQHWPWVVPCSVKRSFEWLSLVNFLSAFKWMQIIYGFCFQRIKPNQ